MSEPYSRRAPGTATAAAPPAPATGVVEFLDRVDHAVATALSTTPDAADVSRDGWRVLLMLARGTGRSMGEIASHTALPAPTATRIVDRLVSQRLAYRSADPLDRRRVLVHLGADGRSVVESVCHGVQRMLTPRRATVHSRPSSMNDGAIPGPRTGAL
ncbi:MarR family winged helix-turn-helix transcriptional regulator [Pseudonocardia endophytica]|uniref:MarR family protein n=1 Tax=Pseudonocardia endophytica TaxID=401976 RepID=A0A4R1HGA4_PSEEN|nr:MarR family transcriptional regulator [Pseudonocardia endophytica]TCK21194.1 MarR family protein [Pseudonocardia endophytica]